MNTYELTYILPSKIEEKEIPKISEKIRNILPLEKIINENLFGKRRLAHPIKKDDYGYFVTVIFETNPSKIEEIKDKLKKEELLRFLILKTEKKVKKKVKEVKKMAEKPEEVKKVKAKPEEKEPKITKKVEKKKMKKLEEKLEEILKE